MKNFIRALFISLLTSGSFMTHAAEQIDNAPWEAISAARREMSLPEYRSLRPFLDGDTRAKWKKQEDADRKEWEEALSRAWMHEHAPEQIKSAQAVVQLPQQSLQPNPNRILPRETKKPEENEYQKLLALRAEQIARRLEAAEHKQSENDINAEVIHKIQQQDEAEERRRQEEASAALIRQLKLQDEQDQRRWQEQASHKLEPIEAPSFISQVNILSQQYASGPKRPVLENFMKIFSGLNRVIQNGNVHDVDGFVATNTVPLLEVGRLYAFDDPKLSLNEVGEQMKGFMNQLPDFFANYKYDKKSVTTARIKQVLDLHFKGLDNLVSKNVQEMWSRAWTLALKLYNETRTTEHIQMIFDEAIEGHETEINGQQGGCLQGRVDRGFIAYATLLGKAGVGIH